MMKIMMTHLNDRRLAATPIGLTCMSDVYVSHAKNAEIWDVNGNRYIDFATGSSTMNVGHSHPKVVEALHKQVDAFTHTFFQQIPYESYVALAERLNRIVPHKFQQKTFLSTDGAGSVENAVKLAKAYTKRNGVITFHGGFHGRTHYTSTLAGKLAAKSGTPATEVYHLPFPSPIDGVTTSDTVKASVALFKHVVKATDIAAIVIEPVQGEGGFRVAPLELMIWLRDMCTHNGIVLIADEVQTGFGRTGMMFAMEHYNINADITCMSKSIAAGVPMSAVTGRADIMDSLPLGGTYGGNPLACAAAHAVLDIIDDDVLTRSNELGLRIERYLLDLKDEYPFITCVRGIGSMMAIEIDTSTRCKDIQRIARDMGLVLVTAGTGITNNVIRFLYPLTIEDDVFEEALDILKRAIDATQS
jgi:4-aminobutyrate aminotransferase